MIVWARRGDLVLDVEGQLYTPYLRGHVWLGPIAEAEVPPACERDRAWLLDAWLDSFDPRAEQIAAYRIAAEGRR